MLEPGDTVRIVDGPFQDFAGTVTAVDRERGIVRVMIDFKGRPTPVDFHLDEIEVIE